MDRYAVVGHPISHSKSPFIHARFAAQTGQAMRYEALEAPRDGFADTISTFISEGGSGLNVTVPFKEEAFVLANERTERAERAQAVNTLVVRPDKSLFGDNTDGVGLIRDLSYHDISLMDRNVLILGAGGAVRGILGPLLEHEPQQVLVANRTVDRARELVKAFGHDNPRFGTLRACSLEALGRHAGEQGFDLIINGTSASLVGALPDLPEGLLSPQGIAYDMAYADEPTAFQRWAEAQGALLALDGLGMLVEQAAESFRLWRGVQPDTTEVRHALRSGRLPENP
ncbi:MAG: shikimate dehydrogenase [Halothiobacillaceae bacterium]